MGVKIIAVGGEIGDACYAMPVLRQFGECRVVCPERPWTRPNWPQRCLSLKRLAESQPYIQSWEPHRGEPIDLDLSTYRNGGWLHGELIPLKIARWARVKADIDTPWIECDPNPHTQGKIIINRAPRWVGFWFPWKKVVEVFQKDILFIGLEAEHKSFCAEFGYVPHFRTNDHYEAARAIKGSDLFIGAQSSMYALAEGMKHDSVLEVCPYAPDCTFHRPNVIHYIDGLLKFSALGIDFEAKGTAPAFSKDIPPRGGYKITIGTKTMIDMDYERLQAAARAENIVQQAGLSLSDIQQKIEQESFRPIPMHFKKAA